MTGPSVGFVVATREISLPIQGCASRQMRRVFMTKKRDGGPPPFARLDRRRRGRVPNSRLSPDPQRDMRGAGRSHLSAGPAHVVHHVLDVEAEVPAMSSRPLRQPYCTRAAARTAVRQGSAFAGAAYRLTGAETRASVSNPCSDPPRGPAAAAEPMIRQGLRRSGLLGSG